MIHARVQESKLTMPLEVVPEPGGGGDVALGTVGDWSNVFGLGVSGSTDGLAATYVLSDVAGLGLKPGVTEPEPDVESLIRKKTTAGPTQWKYLNYEGAG